MSFIVRPEASNDMLAVARWYNRSRIGLGTDALSEINKLFAVIAATPRLYGRVHRPPAGREIRHTIINRFPIVVVYEVTSTDVIILAVTHGKRRGSPWRKRLSP